jgi:hypothetical protein
MFDLRDGPADRRGTRYVVPLDRDTGELEPAIALGASDLSGQTFESSCGERDGWWVEQAYLPSLRVDGEAQPIDAAEVRLRLEPGWACVDGLAATVESIAVGARGTSTSSDASEGFPGYVRDRRADARHTLHCAISAARTPGSPP